jgi:hypothetical protein
MLAWVTLIQKDEESPSEWELLQSSASALSNHLRQVEFPMEENEDGDADQEHYRDSVVEVFSTVDRQPCCIVRFCYTLNSV